MIPYVKLPNFGLNEEFLSPIVNRAVNISVMSKHKSLNMQEEIQNIH